ncbi:Fc receptor-like protein 5 [Seriola lalandi dorsalis]|uniref:Fc receptor-like protein 5 n=1 Tax=Seriola lalandi dorsalis TaxID=1841481 RepID=UPI000C6F98F5|nr:Fc receptor-like protein 5 [Seriola lalandi dorsalis]
MFASLFVVMLGLCYCFKESNQTFLGTPELSGPTEAMVKDIVIFNCELHSNHLNESILLQLFKRGQNAKLLGDHTSLDGEPGTFTVIIKPSHEGNLQCVARPQNRSNIEPTVSNTLYLSVFEPVEDAKIAVRSGPKEFFEGNRLELFCNLTVGKNVSYMWLLNDRPISRSPRVSLSAESLSISRTTSKDSGSYRCEASNEFNNTVFTVNSSEVVITVKDVVSTPDISFTVLKDESHNYSAVVTCQSTKGTPPVIFSLYNREVLVANMTSEDRSAVFKAPLVLDRHLGFLQCQANNGNQTAYSQWLPLEAVSVGGPVTMRHDYDFGENYAVTGMRFYCKAAKGTHPQYQWFLNKTLLHGLGSFYKVVNQDPKQSMLLLSVSRSSTGTYRCEVSNSFDNTTVISSKRKYVDKEVLNRLPVLVVAVVFGCFTFLILLVSVCCGIGVVYRRRQYGEKSLLGLEMERTVAAYEGELDLSEYNEDADVVETSGGDEFDQASEASLDEWPQIAEQKKTLEDEPIELP